MALTLGDNFSYQGAKPLDARLKYDTLANMKAVADATMYDGCLAYCVAADKTYQWKSTNTVDETLGRWREFSSGGGSTGGGHTIEDAEGTSLTQRETLQFGEGFIAEDDDTNEKTVISPDVMQSGDMSDVITPLPSVAPKKEGIKYSTTEQVIGEWIDGRPLYQKTIDFGALPKNTSKSVAHNISSISTVCNIYGVGVGSNIYQPFPILNDITPDKSVAIWCDNTNVNVRATNENYSAMVGYITIQYTKTTD